MTEVNLINFNINWGDPSKAEDAKVISKSGGDRPESYKTHDTYRPSFDSFEWRYRSSSTPKFTYTTKYTVKDPKSGTRVSFYDKSAANKYWKDRSLKNIKDETKDNLIYGNMRAGLIGAGIGTGVNAIRSNNLKDRVRSLLNAKGISYSYSSDLLTLINLIPDTEIKVNLLKEAKEMGLLRGALVGAGTGVTLNTLCTLINGAASKGIINRGPKYHHEFSDMKNSKDVVEANNRIKAGKKIESNQNSIDANLGINDQSGRVTGRVNGSGKMPINVREMTPWGSAEETRGRKPGSVSKSGGYKVKTGKAKIGSDGKIVRDSSGKIVYEKEPK
jgi:hypothetical protein